jgi:hypothetical protein
MTLTKKDFIKVAKILNTICNSGKLANSEVKDFNLIVNKFCEWFKSENPLFNENRFREAVLK